MAAPWPRAERLRRAQSAGQRGEETRRQRRVRLFLQQRLAPSRRAGEADRHVHIRAPEVDELVRGTDADVDAGMVALESREPGAEP